MDQTATRRRPCCRRFIAKTAGLAHISTEIESCGWRHFISTSGHAVSGGLFKGSTRRECGGRHKVSVLRARGCCRYLSHGQVEILAQRAHCDTFRLPHLTLCVGARLSVMRPASTFCCSFRRDDVPLEIENLLVIAFSSRTSL